MPNGKLFNIIEEDKKNPLPRTTVREKKQTKVGKSASVQKKPMKKSSSKQKKEDIVITKSPLNRDFEIKAIEFINSINPNYVINEDGFLYFEDKHLAISFNEKYESSNLYKPTNYFDDLHRMYAEKGIRLMLLFDWQIEHKDSWNKMKMLLITAIGHPKRIMSRKCKVRQITDAEAKPINDQFHTMGHRKAKITYGLFYNDQLVEIMSFGNNKWNRNIFSDKCFEIIRGCMGSLNTIHLDDDPNSLYFVSGGPSRLLAHFIRDYDPDAIFSYCEDGLFSGASYLSAGMKYAGHTPATKYWLVNEIDEETGKMGIIIPRNPTRYKELKERSNGQIIWTPGSSRYVWLKEGVEYQGHGKEFLENN